MTGLKGSGKELEEEESLELAFNFDGAKVSFPSFCKGTSQVFIVVVVDVGWNRRRRGIRESPFPPTPVFRVYRLHRGILVVAAAVVHGGGKRGAFSGTQCSFHGGKALLLLLLFFLLRTSLSGWQCSPYGAWLGRLCGGGGGREGQGGSLAASAEERLREKGYFFSDAATLEG